MASDVPRDPRDPSLPTRDPLVWRTRFLDPAGAERADGTPDRALRPTWYAQDRVLAMDFVYVVGMLVLLVLAIRYDSEMYFEGALVMVLFGFVGSVAMAKFLLRGEVI